MKVAFALLFLAGVALVSGEEKSPPAPTDDKVVVLEPFKTYGEATGSFAISITVYAAPKTKKVFRIFIEKVSPNSDAAKAGLKAGDEIVKFDGVDVKEFDAEITKDSQLGRFLLNRRPGESLELEVIMRHTEQVTLRAQGRPIFPR